VIVGASDRGHGVLGAEPGGVAIEGEAVEHPGIGDGRPSLGDDGEGELAVEHEGIGQSPGSLVRIQKPRWPEDGVLV
jgi:hypothetical protein